MTLIRCADLPDLLARRHDRSGLRLGGVDGDEHPRRWRVRLPGRLAPVVQDGVGIHVEPNIWVLHQVAV